MVVDSRDCNIKLKALNAERAGAHLLVISAADKAAARALVEASYDLTTTSVDLPTVIVTADALAKLQTLARKVGDLLLKFQMPLPQSDSVLLTVNMLKTDPRIFSFLRSFKNYALHFENHLDVQFAFFKDAAAADDLARLQVMANCLDFENVFDALGSFGEFCVQKQNATPDCLRSIAQSFDRKDNIKFEHCVEAKLKGLEAVKAEMKLAGPGSRSFLAVNRMQYNGSLKPENVFEAVCGGFLKSPDYCLFINNKYTANVQYHALRAKSQRHKFLFLFVNVIVSVLILSLAGVAIVLIYRKIYQRVLNERVADMVRESVINYRSLKNNE